MHDPAWRAGLARLARHDLAFDLMVYASQLGEAARIVSVFQINYLSSTTVATQSTATPRGRRCREEMAGVAHSPNVLIKISDLVAYDHNWTLDSLRELVLYCIDSFAPERGHVRQRFFR
jgi:predicted TIM-barrel fold metal-dependent hydrolase